MTSTVTWKERRLDKHLRTSVLTDPDPDAVTGSHVHTCGSFSTFGKGIPLSLKAHAKKSLPLVTINVLLYCDSTLLTVS